MGIPNSICVRFPADLDIPARIEAYVELNGGTLSDFMRQAVYAYLGGDPQFAHTRQQAFEMARKIITQIELPETFEEAVARGLITP